MGNRRGTRRKTYRVCISAITLSSFSTAAIFSAEVGCLAPIPKKDILLIALRVAVGDEDVSEMEFGIEVDQSMTAASKERRGLTLQQGYCKGVAGLG